MKDSFKYLESLYKTMPIDTLVWKPERTQNLEEANDLLARLLQYERERDCKAVILMTQRRQFPASYRIVPEYVAKKELAKPISGDAPEFGIKYYTYAYLEALVEKLNGSNGIHLPEPVKREIYRVPAGI